MHRARIPILIFAVLAGCSLPQSDPGFDSSDPKARSKAAIRAAAAGDERAIPGLISMLDSRDPAVRLIAAEALERITGKTMGYDSSAADIERDAAVDRWAAWWESRTGGDPVQDLD